MCQHFSFFSTPSVTHRSYVATTSRANALAYIAVTKKNFFMAFSNRMGSGAKRHFRFAFAVFAFFFVLSTTTIMAPRYSRE
jgi:hypothetical protein